VVCAAKAAAVEDAFPAGEVEMDARDGLSRLLALAEYLFIRPGINVAAKASAVNASVTSDFFVFGFLIRFTLSQGVHSVTKEDSFTQR